GYRAVKLKTGAGSPADEARRVRTVREAIGKDISLMLDMNAPYDVDGCIEFARRVEPVDIYWLEEPLHWYLQPADFVRLAAATSIPLAHGERELTRFTVRDFIATGAIRYVQFDSARCGFHRGPARRRAGRAARGHDRAAHCARATRASRRSPAALRLRRGIARRCGAQPPVAPPPGRRPRDARQLRSPQRQARLRSGDRLGLRQALRGLIRVARLLRGDRATHRRAMHQTALGHVVVLDRPVLDHAVVPHQHVARPPLMAIHERGLDDVIRQGGDYRLRLSGPYPLDAGAVVAHHVEALAARPRMGPHDGMANWRVTVDFRLRRGQGPLASAEIEHGAPSLQASLHRIRQGVPGRSGTGELGVSQREPVQLGDLDGVQDGPAWWSRGVAHVAVPVLAGAADAGRPPALGDVGQDDDLGVAGRAPAFAD